VTSARAVRLLGPGEAPAISEVDLPTPNRGEQLVALTYAGINPVDRNIALGLLGGDGPFPRTIGTEGCARTAAGDLVVVYGEGLGISRDGVYATAAIVPDTAIVPVPDGVTPQVAASVGVAGATAYQVVNLLRPRPEETILVLGAGGGVGLPIVSYLTYLGARVIGQVGTSAKADAVRAAGAAEVVIADADSLATAVAGQEIMGVVDPLSGPFVSVVVDLLMTGGRYVGFGASAGAEVALNWQQLYRKALTVSGYSGFAITDDERRQAIRKTLELIAVGGMRIPTERTYRLDELDGAFEALASRSVSGKLVLDLTHS
jgi:NADPH:quinone reductase-like Zn-dependent oxidoreductase